MVIQFDNYNEGDAAKMHWRDGDGLGDMPTTFVRPAWSMLDDGQVIACCGLNEDAEGIYTLWAVVSDGARGHGLAMIKFVKDRLAQAKERLHAHRIQVTVRADSDEYNRWIKLFGFELEGVMRQATADKQDMNLYARIF